MGSRALTGAFAAVLLVTAAGLAPAHDGADEDEWKRQLQPLKEAVGFDTWRMGKPRLLPVFDLTAFPELRACDERRSGSLSSFGNETVVHLSWHYRSKAGGQLSVRFRGFDSAENAAESLLSQAMFRSDFPVQDWVAHIAGEFTHEFGAATHRLGSQNRARIEFFVANWAVEVRAGGELLPLADRVCHAVSARLEAEVPGRGWPENIEKPMLVAGMDGRVAAGRVDIRGQVPDLEEGVEWWLDWSAWRETGGWRDHYSLFDVASPGPLEVRAIWFDSRGRVVPLAASFQIAPRDRIDALVPEQAAEELSSLTTRILPPVGTPKAEVDTVYGKPIKMPERGGETDPPQAYRLPERESGEGSAATLLVTYRDGRVREATLLRDESANERPVPRSDAERAMRTAAANRAMLRILLEVEKRLGDEIARAVWNR